MDGSVHQKKYQIKYFLHSSVYKDYKLFFNKNLTISNLYKTTVILLITSSGQSSSWKTCAAYN
jgi:hypothetical protein